MVVNHHPSAATDQRPPQLYRRQPVQMEVGKHTAFEFYSDVSDAFLFPSVPPDRGASLRGYMDRLLIQHICLEGEIMRREIPKDIHVGLEQDEVEAQGVGVLALSVLPGGEDVSECLLLA